MNVDTLAKIYLDLEIVDKEEVKRQFKPYVYFVCGYSESKYPNKFYIGSKSKVNIRDTNGIIGEDYFTSSSVRDFVDDFTLHPKNYLSVIVHCSSDYALEYQIEQLLIGATIDDENSLNRAVYKNSHITLDSYGVAIERMKEAKSKWTEERKALYKERYEKSIASRTKEHEEVVKKNVLEGRKKMWAKRSEEERKAIAQKAATTRKAKTDEEKATTRMKLQEAARRQNERMTDEQKRAANGKRSAALKEKFKLMKQAYGSYKQNGGELKWNEWQKSQKSL